MFRLLIASILIGYLPGALLFRLPSAHRPERAALDPEERVFWAVICSLALSLPTVLALAGLGVYSFNRLLIANGLVAALLAIGARGGLHYRGRARRISATTVIPVAIIGLGMWLYFPPSEYVIGGKDPGTYINEGVQIAQRGRIIIRDEVIASVPPSSRDLFFPQRTEKLDEYYGNRFMGFFIKDPATGRVIGQFPHLFPASIAIGYAVNGLSGARQTIGVWAILGLLAVYFLGVRLFGRAAAAAATGLLAINVAEIWFAKYPNSELVMQTLLCAAILAFARALDGSRRFFGMVAGLLLGMMLFLRYEVVLAFAAFGAAAVLAPIQRARVGFAFIVALAASATVGLWYLAYPLHAYSALAFGITRDLGGPWLVLLALLGAGLCRLLFRVTRIASTVRVALPAAMAATLLACAVYAYFFRQEAGRTALGDAMAFRSFGWYLTPPVLAAATIGTVFLTWRRFWRSPAFFLTCAIFSLFFFYKTRIVPEHFWTFRRFLAITLPGAMLALAGLASEIVGPEGLRRIASWVRPARPVASVASVAAGEVTTPSGVPPRWMSLTGPVLVVLVLAPVAIVFWRASAPLHTYVEYAGLIPHLERLAGEIGDRDLVLVEARNAGTDLHVLAVPLAYIYARNVLVLDSAVPSKRLLEEFITQARTRYANVLFLGGGGTDLLTKHIAAEPLAIDHFQVPEYESPSNAYPSRVLRKEFEFGLYRLVPVAAESSAAVPTIDLSIGASDDLNVVRFHAREVRPESGVKFRWTGGISYVLLLGMPATARHVTIWMSNGGRPATVAPADVEVALELPPLERVIGTARPVDAIVPYTFDIPADVAAQAAASPDPIRLRLRVPTWKPAAVVGGTDTRDLGVFVTRVEVR